MILTTNRTRAAFAAAAAVASLGMCALPLTAQAAESVASSKGCTSTVTGFLAGAQTVATGEKLCLKGATVGGAITVEAGASLSARGSTVNGAITLASSKSFSFCGSTTVGGAISAASGSGYVRIGDNDNCRANTVGGAITIDSYTGTVTLARTTTTGAVVVTNNVATSGKAPKIAANDIGGALSCSGNQPAPTNTGRSNDVHGARSGQCVASDF